jgi:hypothetical protein
MAGNLDGPRGKENDQRLEFAFIPPTVAAIKPPRKTLRLFAVAPFHMEVERLRRLLALAGVAVDMRGVPRAFLSEDALNDMAP